MDLIRRAQDILLKPADTWPAIAAETTDTRSLYTQYLMILAAIPAVAGFIGMSLVGVGGFGYSMRIPLLWGLSSMVVNYVVTLAAMYVMALIVEALAPSFGGTKDRMQALKLVVYGSTAAMVGGIFSVLPALSVLGLLAALYSIYLFYLGIPVLMKCPQDKAVPYTAVVGVLGIIIGVVIGSIVGAVTSRAYMHSGPMGGSRISMSTPKGEVTIDTSKIEEAAKRMEAKAKQMEQQAKQGAIAADQLKALLPESIGDMKRESIEAVSHANAMVSAASGRYKGGDSELKLSLTDAGGALGMAVAMWASMTIDRDTAEETEKVYRDGERTVHEKVRKNGGTSEYQVLLTNGVMVSAEGQGVALPALKSAVAALDLKKAESLARSAPAAQ